MPVSQLPGHCVNNHGVNQRAAGEGKTQFPISAPGSPWSTALLCPCQEGAIAEGGDGLPGVWCQRPLSGAQARPRCPKVTLHPAG